MGDFADTFYRRLRARLTPGLENSQYAYAAVLRDAVRNARRWLDLGCGHHFLPAWLAPKARSLELQGCRAVGIDMDEEALHHHEGLSCRILANGETLPFLSGVFDLITANMVLEHVSRPDELFREVQRVLAAGGRFIVHTPNVSGYTTALTRLIPPPLRVVLARFSQGRDAADVYPTHYRANSRRALRALAYQSGLSLADLQYVLSSPQLIAIPPMLAAEMLLIRALSRTSLARFRPCLLACFQKPHVR